MLSEIGIKARIYPQIDSLTAGLVKWPVWGQRIDFRYLVLKKEGEQVIEEWLVLDENYDIAKWQCLEAGPPGRGRCFVPAEIKNETLIEISSKAKNPTAIPWPRP